ncbi:Zeatin o-glucosyltransferase [Thalictrum thalictroides]|uniref:Zeatin o-glucosyltransferase n=1 Tax=Thalictrum thalictroides TaxID=46969 RepID=A0A7J6VGD5_THATH|nr:Zeatin o-glucosyltransferase [Thalictrum thalictroides]
MAQQHPNCDGVVVVMVPLPAQGHLNQFLHLTRIVSSRAFPVHYIGSAIHNRQAKERVHGWDPSNISNIHFHDIHIPQFVTPPDIHVSASKFPLHVLQTFSAAFTHVREPFGVLLRDLCTCNRRVVVVYDTMMSFAAHEASFLSNAEAYCFNPCSAFSVLHFVWESYGKPADEEGSILPKDIPRISFGDTFPPEFQEFLPQTMQWLHLSAGDIYNTCDAIEGRFVDIIAGGKLDKKVWSMGPFNPVAIAGTAHNSDHKCLEWLNKQPPNSVIFVSFGTSTTMSDDQITQFAVGLEKSEQRFIWVLRDADKESLSMGVPIAAWPLHSDQPANALLVTEVLKAGLLVREWEQKDELLSADTIESSIRKLMVSDEGNMMRKRAKEMGVNVRSAVSVGGTSTIHLESFLNHISR